MKKTDTFKPIITSFLDTDLYKFTMQQTVLHQFPHALDVEFHFKCRTKGIDLVQYIDEINQQLDHLCTLKFKEDEVEYIRNLRYIKEDYADFLTIFSLQRKYVQVVALNDKEIDIVIKGPWLHTILFEVPVLAIVNEVYFTATQNDDNYLEGNRRLEEKISFVKSSNEPDFKFAEFGTRRRYSKDWQEKVINQLINNIPEHFTGTSNVYFAKKYNLTPIGTMAHEYLQACQVLGPRLRESQKFALEKWAQEYRGDLGIALTDVVGSDAFLRDFDLYFCKLFDGVRHDSGNPYEWADKFIAHYKKMNIDPKTKTLVFSDSLDFEKSLDLYKTYKDQIRTFPAIGTNLTNDLGLKPINNVLKMTACNGSPVAKISDSPGKTMCKDETYLSYLREVFAVQDEVSLTNKNKIK